MRALEGGANMESPAGWRKDRRSGLYVPMLPILGGAPAPIHVRALATFDSTGTAILTPSIPGGPGRRWVIERMIAAVATIAGSASDSFTRTVANGWGSADVGGAWSLLQGLANQFSVNGSQGIALGGAGAARTQILANTIFQNGSILAQEVTVTSSGAFSRLLARVRDASNYYFCELTHAAGPLISNLRIGQQVAGVETILGTIAAPVTALGSFWSFTLNGATLEAREWGSAAAPPTAATLALVSTTFAAAGPIGMGHGASSAGTTTFDNFQANGTAPSVIWDAYIGDINQLSNIIDSSVTAMTRWVPALVNGQTVNPGDQLNVVATGGQVGAQAVLSLYMREAT